MGIHGWVGKQSNITADQCGNMTKGAEIGALRKCFLQNPHPAKRQETVRRSMEMVGIKRGQSRAKLRAELPLVQGARYNLRE